jgi:hypothetical protein
MDAEPPTRQMPATEKTTDDGGAAKRLTSMFDLQRVALALVALVVIVGIVVAAFHNDSQGAATVLGVVIPALTAAIGLTAGVQAGERSGDAKAAEATKLERTRIQRTIQPLAASISARTDEVWETLEAASSSPPGGTERVIRLQPGDAESPEVRWDGDVMNSMRADVGRLQGVVEGLGAERPD